MGTTQPSNPARVQQQTHLDVPPPLGAAGLAVPADAPDKGSSPKQAAPKKAPLLPPGFDFVRLPNGELKLVPQLGIQAQRRRETNAASKLIVSASKEARRLVRDVRNEHRLAGSRHKNVQSPAKGQQPGGSTVPPILQNTSTSTRIAALRALEALGSINLNPNPAVRFTPPLKESQAQLGDIGDPWGPRANGGRQAPAPTPQPPLPRPALARELPSTAVAPKAGEPLRKKPRFKAPGATVFQAAPAMPPPSKPPPPPLEPPSPSLPGNMLWIPLEEVVPRTKPSGRRKASSSSVWRLYGILPNQVRSNEQQAYAAPPAKKQKKGGAEVPPHIATIPLATGVSAAPPAPVSGPPCLPAVDSGAPASNEGTVPEKQATAGTEKLPAGGEDANAELPPLPATPAAPLVQPPGAEPSATDSPESDLPIAFLQPLLDSPAAAPTTEPRAPIPPPTEGETLELDLEEDSFGAQESAEAPPDIVPKPANDLPPRDPTVPLEGVYNFAFVADPSLPGVAIELPPGTLRKDGTLRDRAAALKYPSRVQDAAPGADVRRLAVDVSTAPDPDFDGKVAAASKQAAEQPSPLNKVVAWTAQQLQMRGAVMMTSVTDHYYQFLGEEATEAERAALPPAHVMDLIQARLCPLVAASSFSKKHGYMLHRRLAIHHLYEAMADLRAVERRRNRLVGFPSFVPAKVKATNKRGPKAPGTSTEEIVYVVGTEEVGPLLEEEASRELKGKLSEEAKQPDAASPKKPKGRPASKKTGWL